MPTPTQYDYQQAYAPRRSTSFGGEFLSGTISGIQQRRLAEQQEIEDTRSRALEWLKSIPMTEKNAPIVTNLSLDILGAKPGKKHWSDAIFATGDAKNRFVQDLYSRMRSILPKTGQVGAEGNPDITDLNRVNGVWQKIAPGSSAQAMTEIKGPLQPTFSAGQQAISQAGGTENYNYGTVEFPNQGQYRPLPDVFEDDAGNSFTFSLDQTGRGKPIRTDLGKVTTGRERVAQIQAKAKADAVNRAIAKGYVQDAIRASKLDPETFLALPLEQQQPFYKAASDAKESMERAKLTGLESESKKDLAQAGLMDIQGGVLKETGGVSGNSALADFRQAKKDALAYFDQFTPIRAKAESALKALQDLQYNRLPNQYFGVEANQDYQNEKAKLQREYLQAFSAAKDYAEAANRLHGTFLEGGMGTNNQPGDTPFPYIRPKEAQPPGQLPQSLRGPEAGGRPNGYGGQIYDVPGGKIGNIADVNMEEIQGTPTVPANKYTGKVGQRLNMNGRIGIIKQINPGDPASGNYGSIWIQWLNPITKK